MKERQKIELPVENCFKLLDQSFHRVKLFSKIGENISIESLPIDWDIQNDSGLTYKIEPPAEEKRIML